MLPFFTRIASSFLLLPASSHNRFTFHATTFMHLCPSSSIPLRSSSKHNPHPLLQICVLFFYFIFPQSFLLRPSTLLHFLSSLLNSSIRSLAPSTSKLTHAIPFSHTQSQNSSLKPFYATPNLSTQAFCLSISRSQYSSAPVTPTYRKSPSLAKPFHPRDCSLRPELITLPYLRYFHAPFVEFSPAKLQ